MSSTGTQPPTRTTELPTRYDLLRFAYGEVLDATKHQDDKVGRLLGAIAFLTGGALVFANNSILGVKFEMGGHSYPLVAIALAVFIVVDLISVTAYMIAMSAPLTPPGASGPRPQRHSHLYFRLIAGESESSWAAQWNSEDTAFIEQELISETKNIADRADRKYERTTIATNIFLAALVILAPTVVLGVAAATNDGKLMGWSEPVRWGVGLALSIGAFVLLLSQFVSALRNKRRQWAFLVVVLTYPSLLCSIVMTENQGSVWLSGGLWIIVLAVASAISFFDFYSPTRWRAAVYGLAILALGVGAIIAAAADRSDVQLLLAFIGGAVIVIPNILSEAVGREAPSTPADTAADAIPTGEGGAP